MKKINTKKLENDVYKAIDKAKDILSWNVDFSLIRLILPVISSFYKNAGDSIDTAYICMPTFLRNKMMNKEGCKSKLFVKIKQYYNNKYIKHMEELIDSFNDVLIENTDEWEKKWNIKPCLRIEYDEIPYRWDENGKPTLFQLKIKDEYIKNDKINHKYLSYNTKQIQKCYKWRKKQLNWFIKNIDKFWW